MSRKQAPPSRDTVFKTLYRDAEKITVADDRELLSFIGGLIRDRRRWARVTGKADEGAAVGTWLERHPLVVPWLDSHGWTIDDAVAADRQWMAERSADTSGERASHLASYGRIVENDGQVLIVPEPGQPYPVAAIETSQTDRGLAPKPHAVMHTDFHVVTGEVASVCPQAAPKIAIRIVERLAQAVRDQGNIRSDKTIHWCGWEHGLEHTCGCDLDGSPTEELVSPRAVSPMPDPVDDESMLPPARLAEQFGVAAEALRKRLDRWRSQNGEGWVENTERGPREPKYLFRVGSVRPLIDAMIAPSETSSERPAK